MPHPIKAYDVDFNHPVLFTSMDVCDRYDERHLITVDDLPSIGEEVFVYTEDFKNFAALTLYGIGFGFLTTVKDVKRSAFRDDAWLIYFDHPGD